MLRDFLEDPFAALRQMDVFAGVDSVFRRKLADGDALLGHLLDTIREQAAQPNPDPYAVEAACHPLSIGDVQVSEKSVARLMAFYSESLARRTLPGGRIQAVLLFALCKTAHEQCVPFWVEQFDITIPRDRFSKQRKRFAAAALAEVVMAHGSDAAVGALVGATRHPNGDVRTEAVRHLVRLQDELAEKAPPGIPQALETSASKDPAFGPRHLARTALLRAGLSIPGSESEQIFRFQVYLKGQGTFKVTLEVPGTTTFDDLAWAILSTFNWDMDHLYEFHLAGKGEDPEFVLRDGEDAEDGLSLTLAESGLVPRHKFVFFFDFGDCHEFNVTTSSIHPPAKNARYPLTTTKGGPPPQQYPAWE